MISRTIDIRIEDRLKQTQMFFNNKLYCTCKNESQCFVYLLRDYFINLIIELNINKRQLRLQFFDKDYNYFNEYKEGLELYVPLDIPYSDLQDVFKSIGFTLKYIYTTQSVTQYEIICKRKLYEVESFMNPALWYSNKEESWFIIAGSEVHIKVERKINLQFDILWNQIKLKSEKIYRR